MGICHFQDVFTLPIIVRGGGDRLSRLVFFFRIHLLLECLDLFLSHGSTSTFLLQAEISAHHVRFA